jgi:superfamily II DNA or RNA helicase
MSENKHVLAFAPCGFGKSYCISDIAARTALKGKKVVILTHRIILLRQNHGSLSDFNLNATVINDEKSDMDTSKNVYISTVQTIQARLKHEYFADFFDSIDLVLIDEGHTQHSNFLFHDGLLDEKYVIGFTGSPKRIGGQRQLGLDYDIIVDSMTVPELIAIDKLVPCRYFEVPTDISGMKIDSLTGDFQPKSNYVKFDNPALYGGMIRAYFDHGQGRKFVCFCANIAHTIKSTLEFRKRGINAKFVVSNLNKPNVPENKEGGEYERYLDHLESYNLLTDHRNLLLKQSEVNAAFDSGDIDGVCTIEILSTGWDYKPLSCIILNRATQSIPLMIQLGGRVQRPFPGKKDAIVIDMGTNIQRLGTFEKVMTWSLWHETSDSVGIPATKLCEGKDKKGKIGCGRLILASYALCPFCGFRFATEKELRDVVLVERLKDSPSRLLEMNPKELVDFAELRGYKKTWVFNQLWIREESEFRKGMRELGYQNGFIYGFINRKKKRR